jgi:hypothetical protein
MRRQLLLLVALVALFSVLVAAPATAKKPVYGEQVMLLNELPAGGFGLYGCESVSWFGELEIDGETYGMALYPDPASRIAGASDMLIYVEYWKVFSGEFTLGEDGMIVNCEPGAVLLEGSDHGVGSFATGVFHSNGKVTGGDAEHPFFGEWLGRRVQQRGTIGLVTFDEVTAVGFPGTMRLN